MIYQVSAVGVSVCVELVGLAKVTVGLADQK
jgi:hypothetical protein